MTATTKEEAAALYNALRTDAFNDGLAEEFTEDKLQDIMDEHFAGISYKELRKMAEEAYPEKFI